MKFPLLAKVGAIALVGLMLTVVLGRIEGLVNERKGRGEEAVSGEVTCVFVREGRSATLPDELRAALEPA